MSLVVCSSAAVWKGARGKNVELGLSVGVLHFKRNSFVVIHIARLLPNTFVTTALHRAVWEVLDALPK